MKSYSVENNLCATESDKWSAPMELDLSWTPGVYITVNQSPLKRWTESKWMEQYTDTSRSDGQ